MTLAWLWIGFPVFQEKLASMCRSESTLQFILKFIILWALSILPWILLLALSPYSYFATLGDLVWGVRRCPLFRAAEFAIGVLVAVRVQERHEYTPIADRRKSDADSDDRAAPEPAAPLTGLVAACGALLAAALAFHAVHALRWDPACACLEVTPRCYGWLQFVDPRFAPASAALIFTAASLDCAAHADRAGDAAAAVRVGAAGAAVRGLLASDILGEVPARCVSLAALAPDPSLRVEARGSSESA